MWTRFYCFMVLMLVILSPICLSSEEDPQYTPGSRALVTSKYYIDASVLEVLYNVLGGALTDDAHTMKTGKAPKTWFTFESHWSPPLENPKYTPKSCALVTSKHYADTPGRQTCFI